VAYFENDHQMPGLVDLVEDAPLTGEPGAVDSSQGVAKRCAYPPGVLEERPGNEFSSRNGNLGR
jgi:hypothetical protein